MADIQIEIQGQDAVAATEELFSTSGIEGNWASEGEAEREGTLVRKRRCTSAISKARHGHYISLAQLLETLSGLQQAAGR